MIKENLGCDELPGFIAQLRLQFPKARLILLNGELGSGKTTLVQQWVRTVFPEVQPTDILSPTYNLCSHYGEHCVHMDLYRISSVDELTELDLDTYIHSESLLVFVEWPEILHQSPSFRSYCARHPDHVLTLQIAKQPTEEGLREYSVKLG